jgi:hypothetical protein
MNNNLNEEMGENNQYYQYQNNQYIYDHYYYQHNNENYREREEEYGMENMEEIPDFNAQFNNCCLCDNNGHLINSCTYPIRFVIINSFQENIRQMGKELLMNKYISNVHITNDRLCASYRGSWFHTKEETMDQIKKFVREFWREKLISMEKNHLKAICIHRKINNMHRCKNEVIKYITDDILKTCFRLRFVNHYKELQYEIIGYYDDFELLFHSGYERIDFEIYEILNDKEKELPESAECPICYEIMEKKEIIQTTCGHNYCKSCIEKILSQSSLSSSHSCAICRTKVGKQEMCCNNPELIGNMKIYIKKEKSNDSDSDSASDSEEEEEEEEEEEPLTEESRRMLDAIFDRLQERQRQRQSQLQTIT